MEHDKDEFDFWTIDKSMGESRGAQILGLILLIGTIVGSVIYKIWIQM